MKVQDLFEATSKKSLKDVDIENLSHDDDYFFDRLKLTSLEGAPSSISGGFNCSSNKLTSLEWAPTSVGWSFNCSENKITSLEGAPSSVGGDFVCHKNELTSLEGAPSSIGGDFDCYKNKLISLKGAPSKVGGAFWCNKNRLTSLEGAPSSVGEDFDCSDNKLTSLKDIHKQIKHIGRTFLAERNSIKSHVLGLLLIDGLQSIEISNYDICSTINKYLPNTRGMEAVLECQEELINAGFKEYAQL